MTRPYTNQVTSAWHSSVKRLRNHIRHILPKYIPNSGYNANTGVYLKAYNLDELVEKSDKNFQETQALLHFYHPTTRYAAWFGLPNQPKDRQLSVSWKNILKNAIY